MYASVRLEIIEDSSIMMQRSLLKCKRICFKVCLGNVKYSAVLPSWSTGKRNKRCNVMPPTLCAANPVGALIAHVPYELSESLKIRVTSRFNTSIRNDFPVPPTPLMNMFSGLRSLHLHSFSSWLR